MAKQGAKVRLITKWPMIGMETAPEVYLHWIMTYLHEADIEVITSHVVKDINGATANIANVYKPSSVRRIKAETFVMATARSSQNALYHLLRRRASLGFCNGPALAGAPRKAMCRRTSTVRLIPSGPIESEGMRRDRTEQSYDAAVRLSAVRGHDPICD